MNNSITPNVWKRLMKGIVEKTVIPIIGNEMYKFKNGDKLTLVDNYLAEKLLEEYDITDQGNLTLAEAVNYLATENKTRIVDIIETLKDNASKINFEFPLLNSLLSINKIYFYTNTTVYDNILKNEIEKVRRLKPVSTDFSINEKVEDCDVESLSLPFVFNVFGSLFTSMYPALSEEEMLEFVTSFQEKMQSQVKSILDALKNKTLLFLGCSHPEWLMRFFLRVLSNQRMNDWPSRRSSIIVVNDLTDYRQKQYEFLNNYNAFTYDGNTQEFVQELGKMWESYPDKGTKKVVFLSYTQKDVSAVENLKKVLEGVKDIALWYDKDTLYSGDNYEEIIKETIQKADLFIPLISQNCISQPDKYVWKEWKLGWAVDIAKPKTKDEDKNKKYRMPIVIDNADLTNGLIKECFGDVSIEPVPDGNANDDFVTRLKLNLNLL